MRIYYSSTMEAVLKILVVALLSQANVVLSWDDPKLAEDAQFPFHAVLMWQASPVAAHFTSCGGAILDKRWILTSAYCVSYVPDLGYYYVKVGNQDVAVDDDRVQIHQIELRIFHEKYPGRSPALSNMAKYDVGLIKLRSEMVFNDFVKPIKLPRANSLIRTNPRLGYNLIVSGYGVFAYHLYPENPTRMRTVTLPVVPNRVCTESIKSVFPEFKMGEMQACTRPMDGSTGACVGNWGGPVIHYNSANESEVVAIGGWANVVCNTRHIPPVYTQVGYFVNWIKKKMTTN